MCGNVSDVTVLQPDGKEFIFYVTFSKQNLYNFSTSNNIPSDGSLKFCAAKSY